jgi:hypothetical protein
MACTGAIQLFGMGQLVPYITGDVTIESSYLEVIDGFYVATYIGGSLTVDVL